MTGGRLPGFVDSNLTETKGDDVFDTAWGWAYLAVSVGIAVIVAVVWRARVSGWRGNAMDGLIALGSTLVVLAIVFSGDRVTAYSLIGAGVGVSVLAVIFRSRLAGR